MAKNTASAKRPANARTAKTKKTTVSRKQVKSGIESGIERGVERGIENYVDKKFKVFGDEFRKARAEKCKKPGFDCRGGGIYGLGFIGALIYYIQTATGFWVGVLGVLKALVWPAMLVYHLLKYLGV